MTTGVLRVDRSPHSFDHQVANSDIEAERDHLRGRHIVRVLTMKEAITETQPVLERLLKIPANFYVITEWDAMTGVARKEVTKRHASLQHVQNVFQIFSGE